jgi:hypothetical protein
VDRKRFVPVVIVFLLLIAVTRILLTYKVTAQGFDEPCHVAAAIELLGRGTYTLDPVHPPLTRIAIGIPLYLVGERFPNWPASDPRIRNYNDVGNSVLYDDGHYLRNLSLARAAVLPFFVLALGLVFFWTRREFGNFAAAMAALLFSTLPVVLAFSGLAYTDLATGCMQFAALFAFTYWLETPTTRSTLVLGVTTGLALLAKFTTLLFLPVAAVAILLVKWPVERRPGPARNEVESGWLKKLGVVLAVAVIVVWAGYGFSGGNVRESMQISPESMPSFQHFPGPVRNIARSMVLRDSWLPAPALVKGAATAWALNKNAPLAYLLGKEKNGGWWYFFLVAVAMKTPLPFLLLGLIGLCVLLSRPLRWTSLAPAAAVFAVFCVTMFVKYNAGIRHVMVAFPLLAVVAGCACGFLWQSPGRWRLLGRSVLVVLLLWQCISSLNAHPDYIAYFNELAGRDPSRVLVTGCDLDCGQDLFRLSRALHERNVSHLNIAVWSSADMSRMNLPAFQTPPPFQPVTGWLAISLRSLRMGDVFHTTYPPGAFAWLDGQRPVEQVGKTIRLYYFPPNGLTGSAKVPLDSNQVR